MATNYQGGNDVVVADLFQPLANIIRSNQQLQVKQQQEQRRESLKLAEEASKDLSKVSRNGLREADLPAFNKAYNEAKDLAFTMNQSSDPSVQRSLRMQINSKLGEIEGLASQSRKIGDAEIKALNDASSLVGKGYPEKYRESVLANRSKGAYEVSPDFADKTPFLLTYDSGKVDSTLKRIGSGLLNSKGSITSDRSVVDSFSTTGGKRMDVVGDTKTVNDEAILSSLSNEYKKDFNFKSYVDDYMAQSGVTDLNQALAQIGEESKPTYFSQYKETQVGADRPAPRVTNINVNMPNEVANISRQPLRIGKFESQNSITRNDKGVKLSGRKVFYDPETGNKIPVGRDQFEIDFTQDVELPIDAQGNPLQQGDPNAVGTQNFAVGQTVDPSQISMVANNDDAKDFYSKTVLVPEGDRQLFGRSKTIKGDAVERSRSSSSSRNSGENNVSLTQKPKFN